MPADVTLTKDDYAVFSRVPTEWWDEKSVAVEIAGVVAITSGAALRRISRFVSLGLVERRGGRTITAKTEIRRVGK